MQNASFTSNSREDQHHQLTQLVEEKIVEFKQEIENKRQMINKLEEQELQAKIKINSLSNDIKNKAEKIRELESKVGVMKDDESNMSLKELKIQNESLKSQLQNEINKFNELKKHYDEIEDTFNLTNEKFSKLRELKTDSIQNMDYIKKESNKVIQE